MTFARKLNDCHYALILFIRCVDVGIWYSLNASLKISIKLYFSSLLWAVRHGFINLFLWYTVNWRLWRLISWLMTNVNRGRYSFKWNRIFFDMHLNKYHSIALKVHSNYFHCSLNNCDIVQVQPLCNRKSIPEAIMKFQFQ